MVGIFDSGIGGLTVVRELLRVVPGAPLVYVGDTARTPYGNKSPETLVRYALEIADFLLSQGATALVIACNSASAAATDALRERYPEIPVYDVIAPAAEDALRITKGKIGVIGTRATMGSGAHEREIRARVATPAAMPDIRLAACPLFVPLVEEGWLEDGETKRIVRRYLSPLRNANTDTLILGCTHYPLLRPLIQRYMGKRVTLVDPAVSIVERLVRELPSIRNGNEQRFYFTDAAPHSQRIAREWLKRPVTFLPVDLSILAPRP